MGSPYLNSNEAIILSTHNVVINTIPAEAILTSQRLILVDSRHAQLRPQDIPFTALETVTIGDTSAMDPVLSLSVVMKDGTRHTLGIVFPQAPKTKRMGERDEWAVKLREASMNAQQEHGVQAAELDPPWIPGALQGEAGGEPEKGPDVPGDKYRNPPLAPRKPRAVPPSGNRTLVAAGLVLILIIVLAAGVYFLAPSFTGKTGTPATPVPTPEVTETIAQVPVITGQPTAAIPQQVTTPEVKAEETTTPQSLVPQNGVWVKISYDGNYTASFGASGRMRDISGSEEEIYQVPAANEIVEATVEKLDDSGNMLTVSFYNNGRIVKSDSTRNPHGTVDLHADLRTSTSGAANLTTTG
jgi:hypothetical protein